MKRETLEIVVADQSVQWTLRSAESDVKLGSDVFKLQVTDTQVKTINLLVSLQRLLADTARQKWVLPTDWTPDTINEAVYGLTEMAGEQLYGVLFQNPTLANILTNAISRIDDGSLELLRLELEFRGKNDLSADWPWEYLRTPKAMGGESEGKFLAIYTDLVLSRTITVQNPRPLRIDGTPRVLLVVARPKELSVVEADDVIETLKQLDADKKIELLQLVEPLHEMFDQPPFIVTLETVRQQIKSFQPHLVHFIGHGEKRQIVGHKEKYGHLAFLDTRDRSLIAGDAYQTRGGIAVAGIIRPLFPLPGVACWHLETAVKSAQALRALEPARLAVGHGPVLESPLGAMDQAIAPAQRKVQRQASHAA